jgi:PleD family two-component response regulator
MARVLIVQGHARSRADTAATLRAEGHELLEAGSADNGVRLAHDQGPAVVLLDPMLPDRSGYELRLADVSLCSAVLTDSLSGLANRRAAEERLRALTGLARVGMGPLAVILSDLDGFAEVNDRSGDTVARLESEAFLVLLPTTKLDAAWYVAERIRRRTAAIGAAPGPDGPALTASFGVAEHPPTPGATDQTRSTSMSK